MWFLTRWIMRYARFVIWTAALGAAGLVYGVLSTREQITLLGGEPHVIEWWEPYVWPAATFIIVGKVLGMILGRTVGAANQHVARIRRGDIFGPRKD